MADRSFEFLRVWQDSRKFVNDVYDMMENCKDWGFRDQIQRASVSIMNNIAEGCESGSDAKYINFLNISKGSCGEVRSMLYLCEDRGFCSSEKRIELHNNLMNISSGIFRLIQYLSKDH
ncbi:MAG: four helix bundle protein [Bacteroidales bacterium]|nr:four helix bundle protein [Bacteroidales bacterium]